MTPADIVIIVLISALVVSIVGVGIWKRKTGKKGGCGCGCGGCPHANACQTARENKTKEGETYDETV